MAAALSGLPPDIPEELLLLYFEAASLWGRTCVELAETWWGGAHSLFRRLKVRGSLRALWWLWALTSHSTPACRCREGLGLGGAHALGCPCTPAAPRTAPLTPHPSTQSSTARPCCVPRGPQSSPAVPGTVPDQTGSWPNCPGPSPKQVTCRTGETLGAHLHPPPQKSESWRNRPWAWRELRCPRLETCVW